jgi:hypothetical protein
MPKNSTQYSLVMQIVFWAALESSSMPFGVLTACRAKVTLFCNAFAHVRLHSVLMERNIF